MLSPRRLSFLALISAAISLFLLLQLQGFALPSNIFGQRVSQIYRLPPNNNASRFDWSQRVEHFPVPEYAPIPKPSSKRLPKVQYSFNVKETAAQKAERKERQGKVKAALQRCWASYRERAWLQDELAPTSGTSRNPFGGWAATLVDTLDTLWIMDLHVEFWEAVEATEQIDFSSSTLSSVNIFETTIRYFGGILAAYDLSGDKRLLDKALELAHMLYAAFDTPTRMPIPHWNFQRAAENKYPQEAASGSLIAEIGTLSLEFTRLAQITRDPKWYDTIARIMIVFEEQQNATGIPGMWPMRVNTRDMDFHSGYQYTLGSMCDSMYEYLPKMYALLGGAEQYARMHEYAMDTVIAHSLFRPMNPQNADILMTGPMTGSSNSISLQPEGQHLVCFAGGMLALGGRLLKNESHVEIGRKLTDGCVWAYDSTPLGIMPETYTVAPCENINSCEWDETAWHAQVSKRVGSAFGNVASLIQSQQLPPGFTSMTDKRYLLRPEAIESVFYLYRITGNRKYQDMAWRMFSNIQKYTETAFANAGIKDITDMSAPKSDSMESFWTAETLKYFYLVFSEPDLISLDDYVFNTEAHPLKRPAPSGWF